MTTTPDELQHAIRAAAFRRGTFVLPDGTVLDEYFDEYLMASDPHLLGQVASEMARLLPTNTQVLAGLELSGVALAVAVSAATGIPAVFVRRRQKTYGTRRRIEGLPVTGREVVLVDDVVRTGAQLIEAEQALAARSAHVRAAVCVVDRGLGAGPRLQGAGVALHALMTVRS